jgi:uncharacterized protein (DUF1330 family)
MPAYLLVQVSIEHPEGYARYMQETPEVIRKYGGKFLVRGGNPQLLEGDPNSQRTVILEFPDREKALVFYYSPEYSELKSLRENYSTARFVLLDGYDGDTCP